MTRATLRTEVTRRIGRSDKTSEIDSLLDLCLETQIHQAHAFKELMDIDDLSVTASDESEALASDVVDVHTVRYIDGTSSYPIKLITKSQADEKYPSPTDFPENKPVECYVHDGAIYWLPVPSDDFTARLSVSHLPTLAAPDASEPTITTVNMVLIEWCSWQMLLALEQFATADQHRLAFEREMQKAIRADKRKPALHLRMRASDLAEAPAPLAEPHLDPFQRVNP